MASPFLFRNKSLNLNDFLQLQALLDYEQQERDRHIAACQRKQEYCPPRHANPSYAVPIFRQRSIDDAAERQSLAEKQRLEQAIFKLKYLKDQYRRQRNAEIQSYLDAYRRQALIRAVQQEEEERYYRQCIAAALEQQRVNALWQQYLKAKREEEYLRQRLEEEQILANKEESDSDEDEGYSKYRTQQLEELLRHVFAHHPQYFEEGTEERAPSRSRQHHDEETHDLATDEIWKYLSDQKNDSQVPRTASFSSDQKETMAPSDTNTSNQQEIEHESDDESDGQSDQESERQEEEESSEATSRASSPLPAVQEHVVNLQDLIQKLASEPVLAHLPVASEKPQDTPPSFYSDEPKPSGIWYQSQPPSETKDKEDHEEKDTSYLPQHVFTEAEPTPTHEKTPDAPFDKDTVIQVNEEEAKKTKEESDFVDSVAAEQKKQDVDPKKTKQMESLDAIARELEEDSDLVKRWNQVLRSKLNFTKQPEGTLLVTASTDANRKYLGSEDEITRLMLKLDAVDSMGDEEIREKRRTLVKKCEHMVDVLDRMKHLQWENAFKKLEKKKKNNRRRKNKKNKYKK